MTPGGREREPTTDTDHSIHPLELDIPRWGGHVWPCSGGQHQVGLAAGLEVRDDLAGVEPTEPTARSPAPEGEE
jgi:hypothetical protein